VTTHLCIPLGLSPSFGFGDRLGLATPGHVAALKRAGGGILPIFAQQSIREMTRTRRSAQRVMEDAVQGAQAAGYSGVMGADADHLKTPEDIEMTAAAGFCFFTLDPSEAVDIHVGSYDPPTLEQKFAALPAEIRQRIEKYRSKSISFTTGTTISFEATTLMRAAVKYGRAIDLAISLARHAAKVMVAARRAFEIELSIDETPEPTTPAEHYIIADQCRDAGVTLISLAPRFVGDFEKGVDFKGDLKLLEKNLADHAAIAQMLGPYKLSLHSGSDKLSVYPLLARATKGQFHVKTAGTSYLEALRAIAQHDPAFFREIVVFSRQRYETDRATYHVSAELANTPQPDKISDARKLVKIYLEEWCDVPEGKGMIAPGRQILHTTFGSVLTDPKISSQFFSILREHPQTYAAILDEHFSRHLAALAKGM
jgi:hypothetical protein